MLPSVVDGQNICIVFLIAIWQHLSYSWQNDSSSIILGSCCSRTSVVKYIFIVVKICTFSTNVIKMSQKRKNRNRKDDFEYDPAPKHLHVAHIKNQEKRLIIILEKAQLESVKVRLYLSS